MPKEICLLFLSVRNISLSGLPPKEQKKGNKLKNKQNPECSNAAHRKHLASGLYLHDMRLVCQGCPASRWRAPLISHSVASISPTTFPISPSIPASPASPSSPRPTVHLCCTQVQQNFLQGACLSHYTGSCPSILSAQCAWYFGGAQYTLNRKGCEDARDWWQLVNSEKLIHFYDDFPELQATRNAGRGFANSDILKMYSFSAVKSFPTMPSYSVDLGISLALESSTNLYKLQFLPPAKQPQDIRATSSLNSWRLNLELAYTSLLQIIYLSKILFRDVLLFLLLLGYRMHSNRICITSRSLN